jgi:thiol-disulfide isomerase/thioredoxin
MQTSKKFILPAIIAGVLLFLWLNLTQKTQAPDVIFTTIDNKKISMASLKGKVVLVNFWASDCPSCVKEMPDLVNVYRAYKANGFEVINVAMQYDPPAQVLNYTLLKALPFPVMHDGFGAVSTAFGGIDATPTAFIFDKNGQRLLQTTGLLDFVSLKQLLEIELAK